MTQQFKAVYFHDIPAESYQQKSLTIAFGKRSGQLYSYVKDLTSEEIRQLLGTDSYLDLMSEAQDEYLPLNTYCLRKIRETIQVVRDVGSQLTIPGLDVQSNIFDPVSVTFKGGSKEPFIRWYPFLEGYSPQFVQSILERFIPFASRVLDPFGGTGTTAFTAAELRKQSFFCEINPVLQFVSLTKIAVRQLDNIKREKLAEDLIDCIYQLDFLNKFNLDHLLDKAYRNTFGSSKFFDETTYKEVLQIRSWIDSIALHNPLLADLVTIATLSALIPSSLLKRAGDLRYKTEKELYTQKASLLDSISKNISNISEDLRLDINFLHEKPFLICENAKSLAYVPHLDIDAVVTSPPYVNGTNYFRNTKIELWFLRCIIEKKDLARYRKLAITSGINDVTNDKVPDVISPDVKIVVEQLEEVAYDSRIPKMISSYFYELSDVFLAIKNHLLPDGIVAVDIGDSSYAGVNVPSDRLLCTIMQDLGFDQLDEVILRNRRSRSGSLLKQSLLIFKYHKVNNHYIVKQIYNPWKNQWNRFKKELPHQSNPFNKRNWGHSRHSLCSYPGKLKPAIAYHLVNMFVPEGGAVLDPFAGVGTIPFEAALQGKKSFGFEISPAAYAIANGKVQQPLFEDCSSVIHNLNNYIKSNTPTDVELTEASDLGFNGKIADYYEPNTLNEILLARRFFQEHLPNSPEDWFVFASMLHILHGNRPYALSRRSHPITPYKPSGPFEYKSLIQRLKEKVTRGFRDNLPDKFVSGRMFYQDALGWWPREIEELDAIITSPPFFDSTRFYIANWLRLWFSGWSKSDFDSRPLGFVDERQKESFEIYESILRQARERLKSNGVLIFHLGKSKKCDMASELISIGKKWFRYADVFDESVIHLESHGFRDKGSVTSHQYLLLQ